METTKALRELGQKIGWGNLFLTTGGFSGFAPVASGTVGTVAAIPVYLLLLQTGGIGYVIGAALLLWLGIRGANRIEEVTQRQDHGIIVIDEIVGFLVTLWLVPPHWLSVLLGFLAFRVFDIVKPYPARQIDRNPNLKGVGVMLDDVVAGIYGNLVLQLIMRVFLGY